MAASIQRFVARKRKKKHLQERKVSQEQTSRRFQFIEHIEAKPHVVHEEQLESGLHALPSSQEIATHLQDFLSEAHSACDSRQGDAKRLTKEVADLEASRIKGIPTPREVR